MELISRVVFAVFASIYLGSSMQRLLPPRQQTQRGKRLGMYFLLGITNTLPSWVGDENPLLLFPFFIVVLVVCLPGEWRPRLVLSGIFYALLISLNMLLDTTFYRSDALFFVSLTLRLGAWCLLAWFLRRIVPEGGLQLSGRLWLLLGGLTLAPLMAMLSFSLWGYWMVTAMQREAYLMALRRVASTTIPTTIISALALLVAAVVLSRHELLERENNLAALRETYYTALQQEQLQLRTLRHDMNNHVGALQSLLEQEQPEAARRYLAELIDTPALRGGQRYAENETANAVLASKAAQLEAAQLTPAFSVDLPEGLSIAAPELCALLGNALDNAIRGAMDATDRVIRLQARLEKGVFMLRVENAMSGAVSSDLSTTKPDRAQHGLGLPSMKSIAHKHGGTLETRCDGGRFTLVLCFPCTVATCATETKIP